ncbi:GSCOCG00007873001-RA-CDS [Cotesia congregata]|nr:GSCOCG00007873001-RA-CDS [Cotesia congregata]
MEKLLNNRISWWLEHQNILPGSQNGFRKGRSCADNLTLLCVDVLKSFKSGEATAAMFLDIKAAYDNVLPDVLLFKLKRLGFPMNTLAFVYNLVSERSLRFQFGEIDETYTAFRGLPQGSVLSPILYAIYVLELEQVVSRVYGCYILQYADDACLYSSHQNTNTAIERVKEAMDDVCSYLDSLGLDLSVKKTQFCIFDKRNGRKVNSPKWNITVRGCSISNAEMVRFLGVDLHTRMSWKTHIEKIDKKCRNALKTINCLRRTWWGADPLLLLRIYRALIRSRLEYGGLILFNLTKSEKSKLDRIQFRSLRAALGYSSSTPCNVILAEAKEPPLDIRFRYLASNFLARAASRIDHKVLLVLQEVADLEDTPTLINRDGWVNLVVSFREIDKYRHLIMSSNGPLCYEYGFESIMHHPQVSFDEGEEINGSKRCQELFRDIFDEFLTSWTCIFTDGSKDDKAPFGGFSVVLPLEEVELEFRAPRQASIFTLEAIYHQWPFTTPLNLSSNLRSDVL